MLPPDPSGTRHGRLVGSVLSYATNKRLTTVTIRRAVPAIDLSVEMVNRKKPRTRERPGPEWEEEIALAD
jgi:hypothetical protein